MKLMWISVIGLVVMLAGVNLAAAQERPKQPPTRQLPPRVKALRDLSYIEGGHERNHLDLYLPDKADGRLPLIVWIHGGAWLGGNKDGCPAVSFVTKGYAVASINYRLSQHAVFPAQIEDCKAAIRWLRAHAVTYQLDPNHIGVWGASAGGHLVAMLGTAGGVKELEGAGGNLDQSSRVQCVVDWFGPSDLLSMAGSHDNPGSPESRLIGGPVQENKEKARQASPITYVSKDSAPFLIMHGDQDKTVPLGQSEDLAAALKKVGVDVTLRVVEGNGHGGPGFGSSENRKLIEDFFAKHLRPTKSEGKTKSQQPRKQSLITISKQTTCITEPLRTDGYVDYVAALNDRFRQGVTPEDNAAIPFLKAMWPAEIKPEHRTEYCRMLGIEPLAESGDDFVTLRKFVARAPKAKTPAEEKLLADLQSAMRRPWSKNEIPLLAEWLAANEKPLVLLAQASQRSRRYDPLISDEGTVLSILLPVAGQYREAVRALAARAMLRLDDGRVEAAWSDLLTCHRLARLAGRGPTLVELLIATTLDRIACAGDQAVLQHPRLTAAQARKMRDDLARLPPLPKMEDKLDAGERYLFLDCVAMVARQGLTSLSELSDGPHTKSTFQRVIDAIGMAAIDWDCVLRMGNGWFDRLAVACRRPAGRDREEAFDRIERDIRKVATEARDWGHLGLSLAFGLRTAISEQVGKVFVALLLPAVTSVAHAEDRAAMQFELIRLACALAAYRADHDSYPAKLADLVPLYLTEVPKDTFIASDLHYGREGSGYLLYSVGVNGKDNGGRSSDDCKGGEGWDDVVVRVPGGEKYEEKKP